MIESDVNLVGIAENMIKHKVKGFPRVHVNYS